MWAPDVTVCAVVKADAYGHGAVECSRALQAEGARGWALRRSMRRFRCAKRASSRAFFLMTGFWRGEESEIVRLRTDSHGVGTVAHRVSGECRGAQCTSAAGCAFKSGHRDGPAGRVAGRTSRRAKGSQRVAPHLDSRRALNPSGFLGNYGRAFGGRAGAPFRGGAAHGARRRL